jgi:branched-chain amino acid transport system ATP-binding protein
MSIKDLHAYYGDSHILQGVDFNINEGEIACLLGRNGVGKTTLLKSILGLVKRDGVVEFKGKNIVKYAPFEISQLGIGYSPEDRGIFPDMTVLENLTLGTIRIKFDMQAVEEVYQYFPILKDRKNQKAITLSGGEQQMLSIGRALCGRHELLLIDEFCQGLQPNVRQLIRDIIIKINKEKNTAVILVEQDVNFALKLADVAYVMVKGKVVHNERTSSLISKRSVLEEYLVV